nr:hypothetical protein [Tanacetum cinerariifolium]
MALGYQNPCYLKQAQKKQQSLYDGKVLLAKHDPPVVHDSEETLQLAQESRDKMKKMNKEIKPANYTKINHLSGEAAKFVGDFKSLANEADASLAKHKALELEIKRLLKAVVTGSESRPPMLNKEKYIPWSSRLLRDAERDFNVNETFHEQTDDELSEKELKQIEADDQAIQTILLGLPEDIYAAVDSCETAQEIWLRVQQMMKGSDIGIQEKKAKLFNEWERFTSNEGESIESYYHRFLKLINDLKRNKHFPKKIASNLKFLNNLQPEWSRHVTIVHQTKDLHTADYTQLYDFMKYNQKEVDELKAERLAKIQDPPALMANSNNPYASPAPHQDLSPFNQNYMQQPMPNPEDITDPTTVMNMALSWMAKAFKLNYSTLTNNNQRISSNPRNRQIAQPGMNMGQDRQMQMIGGNGGNQFRQSQNPRVQNDGNQNQIRNGNLVAVRAEGNAAGHNGNQNQIGNGNLVAVRAEGNAARRNGNQIRCYNCRGLGHFARDCTVRPRRRDAAYL